jgi:hypothetical protein
MSGETVEGRKKIIAEGQRQPAAFSHQKKAKRAGKRFKARVVLGGGVSVWVGVFRLRAQDDNRKKGAGGQ